MRKLFIAGALLATVVAGACSDEPTGPTPPVYLVSNGTFETGDLTGWTDSAVTTVSGGVFATGDTMTPMSARPVPLPAEGAFWALFDQVTDNTTILYQDIAIPAGKTASFTARIYLNNEYTDYVISPTTGLLTGGLVPNQQFRIDVMDRAADIDDVGAGVLQNLYQTMPGDPLNANVTVAADLSAFAGDTVRLRFAVAVGENFFQVGIDSVQVTGT
ncbi:MAG TPA: hypothetical protein VFV65_06295 [Gemmatimonadales bacterium]|nr:hypothetical protein [Gemmatimonadales bacterium]